MTFRIADPCFLWTAKTRTRRETKELIMAVNPPPKRRSERLNRRKSTLINKAHELAEFCDVDIALIIRNRKTGRYFIYNSLDLESWPPFKGRWSVSVATLITKMKKAWHSRIGHLSRHLNSRSHLWKIYV